MMTFPLGLEIICPADADLFQLAIDLSKMVHWAKKWLLHLNPDKVHLFYLIRGLHLCPNTIWMLHLSPPSL